MFSQEKELKIPVPGGFLAGKTWGCDQGSPVLALHGRQCNAGSFDKLVPLLSPSLYVVAFDFRGHGLSSHKPSGTIYSDVDFILDIECVVRYLKWNQFSIIAHSVGSFFAVMYASLFQERVSNLVLLDPILPVTTDAEVLPEITKDVLDIILMVELKMDNPVPAYSPEDAKTRLIRALYYEVTQSSAEILMERATKSSPCGKGLVCTYDIRIKSIDRLLQTFSHDDLEAHYRKLKCNVLLFIISDSFWKELISVSSDSYLHIFRRVCNTFQDIVVRGGHYVHLNEPDVVAPHISTFLDVHLKENSKL